MRSKRVRHFNVQQHPRERTSDVRGELSLRAGQCRARIRASRAPPSQGGPGPAGVPGSAAAGGGLQPEDPTQEPAEPGPGGLARRAQPLAHGPGAQPRAAPSSLSPPAPAAPAPGRSEPEESPDSASPRVWPRARMLPREGRLLGTIPARMPHRPPNPAASAGKTASWMLPGRLCACKAGLGLVYFASIQCFTLYKANFPFRCFICLTKHSQESKSVLLCPPY